MPHFASTTLDRAQVALTASKRHVQDLKESKFDKVFESIQSPETSAVKGVALQVFSTVRSQIGAFVQSSEGLMKLLDEVGNAHPFVRLAVIPFKAALALELNRVENDKKVLALFTQMNEMMSTLRVLEPINPKELGLEGSKIDDRMRQRLQDAATAIHDCSHATDEYYKMKFVPKLIKSKSWAGEFAAFATKFANLGDGLAADLAAYTGIGVQAIHRTVGRLDEKMNEMNILMKLVFKTLVSPEEQELSHFIETKGGADKFVEDDKLLLDLIHKRENQVSSLPKPAISGIPQQGKSSTSFIEIKEQVKSSLEKSLAESKAYFDQKFEEQKNQLSEVKNVVRHESDRVIEEILSGPGDRIVDKAMHAMWKEMGWKGSAKARHVVLAIRDFYSDQIFHMVEDTKDQDGVPQTSISEKHFEEKHKRTRHLLSGLPALTPDDTWAIKCMNSVQLMPLQEALDPDCSDFVTIHELNEFTSARPGGWSLPLWLAYWTNGFEITLRQYTYRIRALFSEISSLYRSLVPRSAEAYSNLFNSDALNRIDYIVAAIHHLSADKLEQEYPHSKFQQYAAEIERRIGNRLKSFGYLIDEQNTLSLVTGSGRLEEYIFPLLYLILRHIRVTLDEGKTRALRDSDFEKPLTSLETIWTVVYDRTERLKATFRLRNVEVNEGLKKYCYALYYFLDVGMEELDAPSSYYNMPDAYYDPPISDLNSESDQTESIKNTIDGEEEEKQIIFDDMASALEAFTKLQSSGSKESPGLVGIWHGFYFFGFEAKITDGIMGFRIDSIADDNTFTGGGSDALDEFVIKGSLEGNEISFLKEYQQLVDGQKKIWFYAGTVNGAMDTITGKWGKPPMSPQSDEIGEIEQDERSGDEDEENSGTEDGEKMLGTFTVQKKSAEYIRFRPSEEALSKDKPRALWKFALDAIMESVSQRTLRWSTLQKRRDQRRRFIALWTEYQANGLENLSDDEEIHILQRQLSPLDLRFYRHLASVAQSRKVIHQASCDCCSKYPIVMTRYMCLSCSKHHFIHTVDICGDCVDKEFTVLRNDGKQKLSHVPSHPLIQIRRPFSLREQFTARQNARITLEQCAPDSKRETAGISCEVCKNVIKERPHWGCCECDEAFVCRACNLEIEKEQPWLYEVRKTQNSKESKSVRPSKAETGDGEKDETNSSDDPKERVSHHWSHDLVSITKRVTPKRQLSIEERLLTLEERFEGQSKVMEGIKENVGETRKELERLRSLLLQFMTTAQKN